MQGMISTRYRRGIKLIRRSASDIDFIYTSYRLQNLKNVRRKSLIIPFMDYIIIFPIFLTCREEGGGTQRPMGAETPLEISVQFPKEGGRGGLSLPLHSGYFCAQSIFLISATTSSRLWGQPHRNHSEFPQENCLQTILQ